MRAENNFSIKGYNTFGIETRAKYFARVSTLQELHSLISEQVFADNKTFILGGGSNVLFTKDFDGLVIKNEIRGIEILEENNKDNLIRAYSGEGWNDFVNFCVDRELWGVENLSCIPGTVGGAPIQNIGAYGVEARDTITNVGFLDLGLGELIEYQNEECDFGYRDSIFKNRLRARAFVLYVDFLLSKKPNPSVEYAGIIEFLGNKDSNELTPRDISNAICQVRESKLPNTNELGTAGSFFKNPIVSSEKLDEIRVKYKDAPSFVFGNLYKIPAGWLIEKCGWKGYRESGAGVYGSHALILINHGGATGEEIMKLAMKIKKSVLDKFGIELEEEVCLV